MPNLADLATYVFRRNDLPNGQDEIQGFHAAFRLGWSLGRKYNCDPPDSFMIVKEYFTLHSLSKLAKKCADNNISHYLMRDTDVDPSGNPTALAVFPLDDAQREFVRKYPLRRYTPAPVSAGAFDGEAGASYAALAQSPQEHLVSNEEVGKLGKSQAAPILCQLNA